MTPECARADHDGCPDVDDESLIFCSCYCHDDDNGWSDYAPTDFYEPGLGEDRERTPQ